MEIPYLKKLTFLFFLMIIHSVSADVFKVSVPKDEFNASIRKNLSIFDIVSTSENNGNIICILNLTPEEALQAELLFSIESADLKLLEGNSSYSDIEEINRRIDDIINNSSGLAQGFTIGKSVEDRDIRAIRISSASEKDTPEILFVGLHHAREWISYEVPLSIAEFIMKNKDSNAFLQNILNNTILWFVPMLNPDGYIYSWEEDRMWRYNRRIHPDSTIGVDLNRNYDASWIKMDYAHGEAPFSEPETRAVRDLIQNTADTIPQDAGIHSLDGLITYHSYGQLILYPPGSTDEPPQEVELYKGLGSQMSGHIFSQCGSNYLVMQITGLYNTFGEMTEWFMINNDNKPSFTFELRPHTGDSTGFDLSADQIDDTVKENIPAAFYFISTIIEGKTKINMDQDTNGIADIIQGTEYEYECGRDDLEIEDSDDTDDLSDTDEYEDLDAPSSDDDYTEDIPDTGVSESDSERTDDQALENGPGSSGCSLAKLI